MKDETKHQNETSLIFKCNKKNKSLGVGKVRERDDYKGRKGNKKTKG